MVSSTPFRAGRPVLAWSPDAVGLVACAAEGILNVWRL
jgi:hypothetical protein